MKKMIVLMCAILTVAHVRSQQADTTQGFDFYDSTDYNFPQKWSRLFYDIDLSKSTTGFFIDRAINWVDPGKHTGSAATGEGADDPYVCFLIQGLLPVVN